MAFWFGDTASSTALFGRRHVGQDVARRRGRVRAEVADVHRETGLGLPRPELQRVVEPHQVLDRERVGDRQRSGLGDAGDPSAGGDDEAAGQL